ncbi:PAS domain S-box protein, partial [Thermodesulfobacteriota bacterium]
DLAGNITGGMDPAGSPFGRSREEFVGRNFTEFCDEENAQTLFEIYHNVYLTGEPAKEVEWNITAPDGTKICTETSAALMRDADGEPIGFRGIIQDVTERKQAEEALRQSEERLKLAIEGGDLGFWDMNLKAQKGIVNERWAEMLGYTMAEVHDVQSTWENSLHPEDRERVLEEGRKYRAGEIADYEIEYRAVTEQGNIKWLVTRGAAVEWDEQGTSTRMVGTIKDITARKLDEQEIKNSEQRLSQIINFLPDPTFVIDQESKVLAWNKAIEELTGIEPNSILGKGNYEYAIPFHGERRPMLIDLLFQPAKTIEKQYLKLTRKGETLFSESFNPGLRPGGVYLAGNAQPLYDASGEVMGAIETIRDITDLKRTEESLHKARQEADNANKALKNNLKKLQGAYKIIESQKERMEEELNIGRRIQSSFFPESLPQIDGWEIVAHFQAARQVSGDFYDAFNLANNSGVGFVIADVCDKGVGAALFMGLFRSLIRAFSELHYGLGLPELLDVGVGDHPEQNIEGQKRVDINHARALEIILSHTNNYIASTHGKSNMFATLFWGIIEPTDGTLSYINGGHESAAVVGPKGIRTTLEPTGPAVGMLPDMVFEAKRIEIYPGEFLVAFTDGVTEARDAGGEFYGEDNLMQLLNLPAELAEDMLSRITTSLAAHTAGAEQSDDITMMIIRRSGEKEIRIK